MTVPRLVRVVAQQEVQAAFLAGDPKKLATIVQKGVVCGVFSFCVCVTLGITGILSDFLFFGFRSRECQGCTLDWHQQRRQCSSVKKTIRGAGLTYLHLSFENLSMAT